MTYYEYTQLSAKQGWKFNLVVDSAISGIEYVHPTKQKLVVDIYNILFISGIVKSFTVFGSAITDECLFSSDLDICIDWNVPNRNEEGVFSPEVQKVLKEISILSKGQCDVLHYNDLDDTYVKEAVMKGVSFYVHND